MGSTGRQSLAELIDSRRERILAVWIQRTSEAMGADALRAPELIDTLPGFLGHLVDVLRARAGRVGDFGTIPASQPPSRHGSERFGQGMNVASVVREYGYLYDGLYTCLDEEGFVPEPWEQRTVAQCIVSAIALAVTQFGVERDEALRKQASRHIAFLAHEIRNPLTSVRMAWSVLRRNGALPDGPIAARVDRGLGKLERLVDESLVEMKLVAAPTPAREPIEIGRFLAEIAAESQVDAEQKDITLELDSPSITIDADPRLLRSALSNLAHNAVKFSKRGAHVVVRARADESVVTIQVEDECGGLAERQLEKLFDPFVQAGADRTGFGLGLAITKQAVDAHGGELSVFNRPSVGCVFSLTLPKRAPQG